MSFEPSVEVDIQQQSLITMVGQVLAGSALALSVLSLFPASCNAIVDKWTPATFDWSAVRPIHQIHPDMVTGLWMNSSNIPPTTAVTDLVVHKDYTMGSMSTQGTTSIDAVQIPIAVFLGYAFQAGSIAAAGIGLKNTYQTCKQTLNGAATVYKCLEGMFTTAISFGGAYSASKYLARGGGRLLMPHRFNADGTFNMEMNVIPYNRRDLLDSTADHFDDQMVHEYSVLTHLRTLSHRSMPEPEFLGYADTDHRFAKRGEGKHPAIPMYRFEHFKLGSMEIATRDTHNGTFFTLAPSGHPTHLLGEKRKRDLMDLAKRDEYYKHELLTGGAVEAKWDYEASQADPGDLQANAGDMFNTFEPEIECALGEAYPDSSILNVQLFDQTNQATFGFGSMGIYTSEGDADSIESHQVPSDMLPLPQPSC